MNERIGPSDSIFVKLHVGDPGPVGASDLTVVTDKPRRTESGSWTIDSANMTWGTPPSSETHVGYTIWASPPRRWYKLWRKPKDRLIASGPVAEAIAGKTRRVDLGS